jgi:uncharacterized phage-associated protein
MSEIRFSFNLQKLIHSIAFFSAKGVSDLTKLKVAKLLYYADKEHLLRYGRPILGDVYYCLQYGPVPSVALNEMDDALQAPEVAGDHVDERQFEAVLSVKRPFLSGHPRFVARSGYDEGVFSKSEIEVLDNVSSKYGSKSASELVKLTHLEPTWTIPNATRAPGSRAPIPYSLFFEGAPAESQEMLALIEEEQKERDEFNAVLACDGGLALHGAR